MISAPLCILHIIKNKRVRAFPGTLNFNYLSGQHKGQGHFSINQKQIVNNARMSESGT